MVKLLGLSYRAPSLVLYWWRFLLQEFQSFCRKCLEGGDLMDIRIWSAVISATVAILISVLNHFIVEPIKQKRKWKREQLINFYSPAYGIISAKVKTVKTYSIARNIMSLGHSEANDVMEKNYFLKFIHSKSGYASFDSLNAWSEFVGTFPSPGAEESSKFIMVIIKDYNRLKKELGYEYNSEELRTGIPEVIKELREDK